MVNTGGSRGRGAEGTLDHPHPPKKGGEKEKREREEKLSLFSLCVLAFHSNVFSCIKHSTDKSGFPFITSEIIIFIIL